MLGRMTAKRSNSLLARLPAALPLWSLAAPLAAVLALAGLTAGANSTLVLGVVSVLLIAAVLAAVHHAEVVAHRVGEPYGSLVLAVAVTIIEVALIVSLMLAGGESTNALARDTVFSAIMIVCNGVLGLCILVGGWKHQELAFRVEGTSPTLAVLAALSVLTLVLPAFTTSSAGPTFTTTQLLFAGGVSLVLYGAFVFVQAVRHRDYFLPVTGVDDQDAHAAPPSWRVAGTSLALLLVCLVGVVGLAKLLAPTIERGVQAIGAPPSLVGVIVAMLVLLPETVAAVRAALHNRLQTSLNLALGSGLASIGLTIPTVAVLSPLFPHSLVLGLTPLSMVLLFLTFIVGGLTLGGGRATVLQGAVHMVVFVVFLFLAVFP
jgi:Ca2+:H+ antiporter